MKKTLLVSAALIGAAFSSLPAIAADAVYYARASAAWFEPVEDDVFDGDLGTLVAVGRNFGAHSVELETGYVVLSESPGPFDLDLEIVPVTVGYRYNFKLSDKLTLGLAANTGVAVTEFEIASPFGKASDDDTVWIASGGVRLNYALTQALAVSAGYRYLHVDDLEYFNGLTLDDAHTQVIELGLEFHW